MLKDKIRVFTHLISSSVLSLMALASPVFGAGHKIAEKTVPAVVLSQKSFACGKVKTTLAANAVRIEAMSGEWVMVAKAPTWKVGFYNTKSKKALEMSFNDYIHHEIQYSYLKGQTLSPEELQAPWEETVRGWNLFYVPSGKIQYLGTTCNTFWHVYSAHTSRPDLHSKGIYYGLPLPFVQRKGQLVVDKFLGCETDSGIAVYYYKRELNKNRSEYGTAAGFGDLLTGNPGLRSSSLEQKSVPSSQFNYLEGFSPVHKEVEIFGYNNASDSIPLVR